MRGRDASNETGSEALLEKVRLGSTILKALPRGLWNNEVHTCSPAVKQPDHGATYACLGWIQLVVIRSDVLRNVIAVTAVGAAYIEMGSVQ